MTAIQKWLGRARGLHEELEQLQERRERAIAKATRLTPNYDGNPVSGSSDPHRKIEEPILTYIDSLTQLEHKLDGILAETTEAISSLDSVNERLVLGLFYLDGESVEVIAGKMDYSMQTIYRIKNSAEDNLAKKYTKT